MKLGAGLLLCRKGKAGFGFPIARGRVPDGTIVPVPDSTSVSTGYPLSLWTGRRRSTRAAGSESSGLKVSSCRPADHSIARR